MVLKVLPFEPANGLAVRSNQCWTELLTHRVSRLSDPVAEPNKDPPVPGPLLAVVVWALHRHDLYARSAPSSGWYTGRRSRVDGGQQPTRRPPYRLPDVSLAQQHTRGADLAVEHTQGVSRRIRDVAAVG